MQYHVAVRNAQVAPPPAARAGQPRPPRQCDDAALFLQHLARRLELPTAKWGDTAAVATATKSKDKSGRKCGTCKARFGCAGCGAPAPRPCEFEKALRSQQGLYNSLFEFRHEVDLERGALE